MTSICFRNSLQMPSEMLVFRVWNACVSRLECKCFASGMQAKRKRIASDSAEGGVSRSDGSQ